METINTTHIKVYRLITGEFLISEYDRLASDDEVVMLMLPAVIVPMQQQGQGQGVGFQKFVPFTDSSNWIKISRDKIMVEVDPISNFIDAYEGWKQQVKQAEGGIITPNMHIPREELEKIKKGVAK